MKNRIRSRSISKNIINIIKHKRKNPIINENISSSSNDSDHSIPNTRKQILYKKRKNILKRMRI